MKRLLILLVLLALVAVPVSGLSLTFQDASEFSEHAILISSAGSKSTTWIHSTYGNNSYVRYEDNCGFWGVCGGIANKDPLPMTYASGTFIGQNCGGVYSCQAGIALWDSGYNKLYDTSAYVDTNPGRYEVKMVGGIAYIYKNGILKTQSGVLAQNPSYVTFGARSNYWSSSNVDWDDLVYGTSENHNIFGSPEQGFFIKKDMVNPAASGFYYPNGTIISNYNMTTTWGVGDNNASRTIQLKEWSSGNVAGTYTTTPGAMAGSISWPIYDDIINNPNSPYGYYITTIADSGEVSTVIPYIADGATVTFDRDTYARGDTATVSYSVDSGGYWNTGVYLYRLDLLDVYGNVIGTQPVSMQTGSKTFTFGQSDSLGVYYSVLIAEPIAGGDDIWMNYDYAELTGYLVLTGKVYDAETGNPIPVANVSISQNGVYYNKVTSVDGNYTTNAAFYSGATVSVNVTSSGYRQYLNSFTPLEGKTVGLNFTLLATTPATTGLALGGIARDSIYGRPIPVETVTITNTSYGESYSVTGNSVGYYLADETKGIFLTNGRCYSVVGSKTGYSASSAYFKCVVGS